MYINQDNILRWFILVLRDRIPVMARLRLVRYFYFMGLNDSAIPVFAKLLAVVWEPKFMLVWLALQKVVH